MVMIKYNFIGCLYEKRWNFSYLLSTVDHFFNADFLNTSLMNGEDSHCHETIHTPMAQ